MTTARTPRPAPAGTAAESPTSPSRASDPAALRSARPDDVAAVERLLGASGLPTAGVAELLADRPEDFVVVESADARGDLVAVAGLEVCGGDALLRSVAVDPAWRGRGLGGDLVRRLIGAADARGLRALYLLTTTAEHYFPRLGFARVDRVDVPAGIAATVEFRSACPASAIAMERPLARAGA